MTPDHLSTTPHTSRMAIRCAIYTRKSTDENLDTDFNSLDAQREAAENYIRSQAQEGWVALPERYDDGAFSGATLERPSLQRLLRDIEAGKIDVVVIYKIDRLSRSLLDFAKLIELFDRHKVTMVSVTQQFNTTTSMGRLTLNVLLSFAQFEREVITERIRDKVAGAKRRGKWLGGTPPLGYDIDRPNKRLSHVSSPRPNSRCSSLIRHRSRRTACSFNRIKVGSMTKPRNSTPSLTCRTRLFPSFKRRRRPRRNSEMDARNPVR